MPDSASRQNLPLLLDRSPPKRASPLDCCRLPAVQSLQQHGAEAAGLDMYGRSLQANAWVAPRLLVREARPSAKVRHPDSLWQGPCTTASAECCRCLPSALAFQRQGGRHTLPAQTLLAATVSSAPYAMPSSPSSSCAAAGAGAVCQL